MVDKHDPLKRVKYSESKGQGGSSPLESAPKVPKFKQLKLFETAKLNRKDKFKNNPLTSPNVNV